MIDKIEKQIKPGDLADYGKDKPMKWLYESYNASTLLYKGIEQNNKIGEQYYDTNIALVEERLGVAGLRLAYTLNETFKNYKQTSDTTSQPNRPSFVDKVAGIEITYLIELRKVSSYVGKTVSVKGKVFGYKDFGTMVLVNLGAAYPNQPLTLVLRAEAKKIATSLEGKQVTIIGKVTEYKGKPQIEVTNPTNVISK